MRLKNNIASQRSRLNRKIKQQALQNELFQLEEENQRLSQQDTALDKKTRIWEKKLLKLAIK